MFRKAKDIQCKLTDTGCFEVISHSRCTNGYPVKNINKKPVMLHRYVYAMIHGPIPFKKCVLHTCDNPACINPAHLWLGTQQDNVNDKVKKNRQARGETSNIKLTTEIVKSIISNQSKPSVIAKQFNVSERTVYRLKAGTSWRHLQKNPIPEA